MRSQSWIHSFEIAPGLQSVAPGKRICCVAVPICLDYNTGRHLLATVPQYEKFVFQGRLESGNASYSLMRVVAKSPEGNVPVLGLDDESMVFPYPACTWDSSRKVIELCCGMGALGHGASASGFTTVVGCDIRPKMLELFAKHCQGQPVLGDICEFDTLKKIHEAYPYSCVIASGIACQPYSQLGDQKGGSDPRASTLPATLSAAFYLRAMDVVIECVGPAKDDPFVQHHIRNFCSKTGFHKSECIQDLKDIWGSKRSRWWCVLSAPAIGLVDLMECRDFPDLSTVGSIIPKLRPWPSAAEEELSLTSIEIEAFQPGGKTNVNHLLNVKAPMACALHCWGSQLIACPCGCRDRGLSKNRLDLKGLFAVLVEGVTTKKTRHIHPQEAGALCGLDPCLTWGSHHRLTLGAVGQLASPLQALWVFSHVLRKLQLAQFQVAEASPKTMMMAYRAWLLARCVRQWGSHDCKFPPTETLELSGRWNSVIHHTFQELKDKYHDPSRDIHVQRLWELVGTVNVAPSAVAEVNSVVDEVEGSATPECPTDENASMSESIEHGLTLSQVVIDTPSLVHDSPPEMEVHIEDLSSIENMSQNGGRSNVSETSISSSLLHDVYITIHGSTGEIGTTELGCPKAQFKYEAGCTIADVIQAELELHKHEYGDAEVLECFSTTDLEGSPKPISSKQLLCHDLKCRIRVASSSSESDISISRSVKRQKIIPQSEISQPPSVAEVVHPLTLLQGNQFLKMTPPIVRDLWQASSLLSQECQPSIRSQILLKQGHVWADDEIRWHLTRICMSARLQCVIPIDPLLVHGCIQSMKFDSLRSWLSSRDELAGVYITAVLHNGHWYPVCMDCRKGVLSSTTWDIPSAVHTGLDEFCGSFAAALAVKPGPVVQHSRLFAGDQMCGAASIAYLDHRILGTQLPEVKSALECLHQFYRNAFCNAIENQEKISVPWLWGF